MPWGQYIMPIREAPAGLTTERSAMSNELYHFGIKGQKWGIRRFQNKNGGLTSAGRKRYDDNESGNSSGKKELTPEQRAARNKKIRTAAIITGATAVAAISAVVIAKKYKERSLMNITKHLNDQLGNDIDDVVNKGRDAVGKSFAKNLKSNPYGQEAAQKIRDNENAALNAVREKARKAAEEARQNAATMEKLKKSASTPRIARPESASTQWKKAMAETERKKNADRLAFQRFMEQERINKENAKKYIDRNRDKIDERIKSEREKYNKHKAELEKQLAEARARAAKKNYGYRGRG